MRRGSESEDLQWSRPRVDAVGEEVRQDVTAAFQAVGPEIAAAQVEDELRQLAAKGDSVSDLRRLLLSLALVEDGRALGVPTEAEAQKLLRECRRILAARKIHPQHSALSDLHHRVADAERRALLDAGRPFAAQWAAERAKLARAAAPVDGARLALAETLARTAQGDQALELLTELRAGALTPADRARAELSTIAVLRAAGDVSAAAAQIARASRAAYDEAQLVELEWHAMMIEAQRTHALEAALKATGRKGSHRQLRYVAETLLWARALPSTRYLERIPTHATVQQAFSAECRLPGDKLLLQALAALERAHDRDEELHERLERLGRILERVDALPTLEQQLLVLAAATRSLVRLKQLGYASVALTCYQDLSLRASGRRHEDALGLIGELALEIRAARPALRQTEDERLPVGIERMSQLAIMAIGLSASRVSTGLKKLVAGEKRREALKVAEAEAAAVALARIATRLKGPVAKFVQIAAYAHPGVTPKMREALIRTHGDNVPLSADVVRRVVRESLGARADHVLHGFDPEPLGVGSIAQVHRCRLPSGESAVVKVRYPGIEAAVQADLKLARMALPLISGMFPRADLPGILARSEQLFLKECDLAAEAAHQEQFRSLYAGDGDVVIPKVHHDLSTRDVLVMEHVEGRRFHAFLESSSEAERQRIARVIYRFGFTSVFGHGYFNADPHPGNYLVTPEGKLAVLDFGCTERYDPARLASWKALARAGLEGDRPALERAVEALGFVAEREGFDFGFFDEMARALLRPITEPGVGFSPEFAAEILHRVSSGNTARKALRLPIEDVMLARFFWSTQVVLGELRATGDWGEIFLPLVGVSLPPRSRSA